MLIDLQESLYKIVINKKLAWLIEFASAMGLMHSRSRLVSTQSSEAKGQNGSAAVIEPDTPHKYSCFCLRSQKPAQNTRPNVLSETYEPKLRADSLKNGQQEAVELSTESEMEESVSPSSVAAPIAASPWKQESNKKEWLETEHSTGVVSFSDDSLMNEDKIDYNLNAQSQEELQKIIRCFPFPPVRSSPLPVNKKSIVRTISNDPAILTSDSCCDDASSTMDELEPGPSTVACSGSCNNRPTWQQRTKQLGHLLHRVISHEAPEGNMNAPIFLNESLNGERGALGRLCKVSVDTMAITALPLDCWLKERLKSWVQLSGHEGTIMPASNHTLWKKQPSGNTNEAKAYSEIMKDYALRGLTPKFFKEITHNNESFIEIQDLLSQFPNTKERAIMDIKMGSRTFLESEVKNGTKRKDLYRKMVSIDPKAPKRNEHAVKAVTKLRYMQFRESMSSTATLGFRIEAAQLPGGSLQKSFQKVKTKDNVATTLTEFFGWRAPQIKKQLAARLREMRNGIERSEFFRTHEVVGSSIFIVFDNVRTNSWMIDFAKSTKVPNGVKINHRRRWRAGNHEDGFLFGLDNLIEILER